MSKFKAVSMINVKDINISCFIFHASKGQLIIDPSELENYKNEGWRATPFSEEEIKYLLITAEKSLESMQKSVIEEVDNSLEKKYDPPKRGRPKKEE